MKKSVSLLSLLLTFSWFALSGQTTDLVRVVFTNMGPYAQSNDKHVVFCQLDNPTSSIIDNLVLKWQIDDGSIETSQMNDIGLQPWNGKLVLVSESLEVGAQGNHLFKLWVDEVEGQQVATPDTLEIPFEAIEQTASRMVLLESFSSSSCGTCAGANAMFRNLSEKYKGSAFFIDYQIDCYSGNPMCLAAANDISERKEFYNVLYTPFTVVNNVFADNSYNLEFELIDAELYRPSPMTIDGTYEVIGLDLQGRIHIEPFTNIPSDNLVVLVAIIEDAVEFDTPPGSNGQKVFYHVLRRLVRVPLEDLAPLDNGSPMDFSFSENFSELGFDMNQLRVVAFAQDTAQRAVLQTQELEMLSNTVAVSPTKPSFNIYPNPSNGTNNFHVVLQKHIPGTTRIVISNMLGQTMWEGMNESSSAEIHFIAPSLASGTYIVSVENSGILGSRLLIVR